MLLYYLLFAKFPSLANKSIGLGAYIRDKGSVRHFTSCPPLNINTRVGKKAATNISFQPIMVSYNNRAKASHVFFASSFPNSLLGPVTCDEDIAAWVCFVLNSAWTCSCFLTSENEAFSLLKRSYDCTDTKWTV